MRLNKVEASPALRTLAISQFSNKLVIIVKMGCCSSSPEQPYSTSPQITERSRKQRKRGGGGGYR